MIAVERKKGLAPECNSEPDVSHTCVLTSRSIRPHENQSTRTQGKSTGMGVDGLMGAVCVRQRGTAKHQHYDTPCSVWMSKAGVPIHSYGWGKYSSGNNHDWLVIYSPSTQHKWLTSCRFTITCSSWEAQPRRIEHRSRKGTKCWVTLYVPTRFLLTTVITV